MYHLNKVGLLFTSSVLKGHENPSSELILGQIITPVAIHLSRLLKHSCQITLHSDIGDKVHEAMPVHASINQLEDILTKYKKMNLSRMALSITSSTPPQTWQEVIYLLELDDEAPYFTHNTTPTYGYESPPKKLQFLISKLCESVSNKIQALWSIQKTLHSAQLS